MVQLIIFDCDGTLVDSEYLYNSITSELLIGLGFEDYTPERCIELFAGQAWSTIKADLEALHGDIIPHDIVRRYIETCNQRMDTDLRVPDGAEALLDSVSQHYSLCVASNGERGNVIKSLSVTGLIRYFDERRIFTKIEVSHPKPAPDLFLHAAEQMGFAPSKCVVIEDSPAGVEAAVAANMRVVGFTGCAHDQDAQTDLLAKAGAKDVISHLSDFIDFL